MLGIVEKGPVSHGVHRQHGERNRNIEAENDKVKAETDVIFDKSVWVQDLDALDRDLIIEKMSFAKDMIEQYRDKMRTSVISSNFLIFLLQNLNYPFEDVFQQMLTQCILSVFVNVSDISIFAESFIEACNSDTLKIRQDLCIKVFHVICRKCPHLNQRVSQMLTKEYVVSIINNETTFEEIRSDLYGILFSFVDNLNHFDYLDYVIGNTTYYEIKGLSSLQLRLIVSAFTKYPQIVHKFDKESLETGISELMSSNDILYMQLSIELAVSILSSAKEMINIDYSRIFSFLDTEYTTLHPFVLKTISTIIDFHPDFIDLLFSNGVISSILDLYTPEQTMQFKMEITLLLSRIIQRSKVSDIEMHFSAKWIEVFLQALEVEEIKILKSALSGLLVLLNYEQARAILEEEDAWSLISSFSDFHDIEVSNLSTLIVHEYTSAFIDYSAFDD